MLERGVPDLGTAGEGVTVGGRWIRLETDAEFEVPRARAGEASTGSSGMKLQRGRLSSQR